MLFKGRKESKLCYGFKFSRPLQRCPNQFLYGLCEIALFRLTMGRKLLDLAQIPPIGFIFFGRSPSTDLGVVQSRVRRPFAKTVGRDEKAHRCGQSFPITVTAVMTVTGRTQVRTHMIGPPRNPDETFPSCPTLPPPLIANWVAQADCRPLRATPATARHAGRLRTHFVLRMFQLPRCT